MIADQQVVLVPGTDSLHKRPHCPSLMMKRVILKARSKSS